MNKTSKKNNYKKVLIIHTDGNTFNNPSLKCIIDLLINQGCKIDLRYPKSHAPMTEYDGVRLLPYGKRVKKLKSKIFDIWCFSILIYISIWLENIIYYSKYNFIIGVDRQGLIEASLLNKIKKTPYVFISFEIMFASETSKKYKSLEKIASKNVSAWIVQDEIRAQQLEVENNLDPSKKILLPLSSAGAGIVNKYRLRDKLGIPSEKKVAIVIGSICQWAMSNQILASVTEWPEDWVLIVHERYGRTLIDIDQINDKIGNRIFLSTSATDFVDDMGSILSGIAVGLAFYEPDYITPYSGKNIKYLGLSSGKISTYLRYGIPVIVNNIGLYADEIIKNQLGYVVDNPNKIADHLKTLPDKKLRKHAKKYFTEQLDFNKHKKGIIKLLSSNL